MNCFRSSFRLLCLGAILLVAAGPAAAGKAAVKQTRTSGEFTLGNDAIEIVFDAASGRTKAARLVNKLAGRTIPIASDDFAIGLEGRQPLRSADFTLLQTTDEAMPGGRRLIFQMEANDSKVELKLIYELGDADFFLRRRMEISPAKPLELRELEAWRVGIAGAAAYQGYGVPVFLDDTFWGLEFPGGRNAYVNGAVSLTHHPGRTIDRPYLSKSAVLGAAEPGQVRRRFLDYVKTFQATPKDLKLFVNYNTWWTLMPPDEKNCLELIDLFREKLFLPHGVSIDTFTIDDGWDDKNSLWKIRADRFPDGFKPVVDRLKSIDAKLGLWLSPSSGYSHAPWGEANGYARNSNDFFLCQSWPKYRRDIKQVVADLARQYDVAFFKFDGFGASCEKRDHGHLPGDFAREANIEAFQELMEAVRATRPGCYIDPTCGMWLSPWWLREADSIWGPVSGDQASAIVPAPVARLSSTTTRDAFFRLRCRDYQGFPPAAVEHLGIIVITPEPWEDNAMAVLGRGCRLLTLYINPACFKQGERDWAFLASVLKWARHNGETLHNDTEMLLGDPMKRRPYGYAHFHGRRGVVSLRNPFIDRREVEVRLDESAGWRRDEATAGGGGGYLTKIVYPRWEVLPQILHYGDALKITLEPYETLVLHVEPPDPDAPTVAGTRCRQTAAEGNRAEYVLYAHPGRKQAFSLLGPERIQTVSLDGRELPASSVEHVLSAAESPPASIAGGGLSVQPSAKMFKLSGDCTVNVPADAKASVHVLCEFPAPKPRELECQALVDGRPAKVEVVRKQWMQMSDETDPGRAWTWFKFDVPAGQSRVEIAVDNYQADGRPLGGEAGWWLWTERTARRHKLVLESDRPIPPADDPLPLPLEIERYREVLPIRGLTPVKIEN